MHKLSWIFWELIVKPKKLKVTKLTSQVIFYIGESFWVFIATNSKKGHNNKATMNKKNSKKEDYKKVRIKIVLKFLQVHIPIWRRFAPKNSRKIPQKVSNNQ